MLVHLFPCYAASSGSTETWDAMMGGIKSYSSDRKLRERFDELCSKNDTALIDGRVDTGGGLYMIVDVPVYNTPKQSKRRELPDATKVVLTGTSQEFEGSVWKEIEFLFISEHSGAAVSIDKAWVNDLFLKK
ncbi:hypothetical protein D4R86_01225 [bacterium]|nr:MAG: hypothetical protein D4R86_01225 [bacterium]